MDINLSSCMCTVNLVLASDQLCTKQKKQPKGLLRAVIFFQKAAKVYQGVRWKLKSKYWHKITNIVFKFWTILEFRSKSCTANPNPVGLTRNSL